MSKRAEKRGLEAVPPRWRKTKDGKGKIDSALPVRKFYIRAYELAEKDTIDRAIAWLKEHANEYIVDLTPTYPDAPVNIIVGGICWEHLRKAMEDEKTKSTLDEIDQCPLQQEDIPETALCATCPNRRNTHAYLDGYDAGRADALKEQQPEPTCKTCGFFENNCPFIRGKFIPYPNKVCKDYTYSAMKEQEQPEVEAESRPILEGIFDFDDISCLELAADEYRQKYLRTYPVTIKHQHDVLWKLYKLIGVDRDSLDDDTDEA